MNCRPFALIACLSLLSACGSDSPTGPTAISGTVTFSFTGGGGGSYNATGGILPTASDASAQATTWSTGWSDNTDNSINIASNVKTSSTLSNFFGIVINRQTVGTANINPNCVSTNTTSCTDVILFIDFDANGNTNFVCALDAGSVTIATITASRATGTFSGTGTCVNNSSASSAFAITNGSFDVPLQAVPTGI
jgi:hypothetical protein